MKADHLQRIALHFISFLLGIAILALPAQAAALSFTFSDKDYLGGASWGTLDIDVFDSDSLQLRYEAAPAGIIPSGAFATGFAFHFATIPSGIGNPSASLWTDDRDDLNWIVLNNLDAFPNPANGDEFSPTVTKSDFHFGATEGNSNNMNPPGIRPGECDVFYLDFASSLFDEHFDLGGFVTLTGVRLQGLPGEVNGGSLALAGKPQQVPEPVTGLFLAALLGGGLGLARNRKPGAVC